MNTLFHKTLVIADLHFGRNTNSPIANQDNLDFLDWAIDEARSWGAKDCIMLGDWHDNRHSIHVSTILSSLDGMDFVNKSFDRVFWLPGNHDLLYRERRDAASIEFARYLPNIEIIRNPTTVDGVTFLPWLVGDEHKKLKFKSRYVFGHLEMPGFLMNARVEMPDSDHAAQAHQFDKQDYVFSGHFHMRQIKKNVCYTGNIMPFNFSDEGDENRGIMLLEWGKEPIFKSWPSQPLYLAAKLSSLLENADKVLKPNMTVRATLDLPLRHEEAQEIRDNLIKKYSLRKIEMFNLKGNADDQDFKGDVDLNVQTVDQIVIEGLKSIESSGLSSERLIDIYRNLPEL